MNETRKHLLTIANVATGGDQALLYFLEDSTPTEADMYRILYENDIVKTEEVVTDVQRAYYGRPPVYFATADTFVRRFLDEVGVSEPAPSKSEGNVMDQILSDLSSGTPIGHDGIACHNERRVFYQSFAWKTRAKAVRALDRFRCRECGTTNTELHAHHSSPIQSVFGRRAYQNFDIVRLKTLCKSCHEEYHASTTRDAAGFHRAGKGELKMERERDRLLKQRHDEEEDCQWCDQFS